MLHNVSGLNFFLDAPADGRQRPRRTIDDEQVRRLGLIAIVGASLWGFGLFVDTVLVPLILKQARLNLVS